MRHLLECVCARARLCTCTPHTFTRSVHKNSYLRVRRLFQGRPVFGVCCVHLAVLGTVGGGLASSAHEWLLQRLGAFIAQRGIAASNSAASKNGNQNDTNAIYVSILFPFANSHLSMQPLIGREGSAAGRRVAAVLAVSCALVLAGECILQHAS